MPKFPVSQIDISGKLFISTYGGSPKTIEIKLKGLKQSKSGVYCLRNKLNGRLYIGMARNLENRKQRHFRDLSKGIHHSELLIEDYISAGFEHREALNPEQIYEFEVIIYCRPSELTFYENILITNLNPYYNTHKKKEKIIDQEPEENKFISDKEIDEWIYQQNLAGIKIDETREEVIKMMLEE